MVPSVAVWFLGLADLGFRVRMQTRAEDHVVLAIQVDSCAMTGTPEELTVFLHAQARIRARCCMDWPLYQVYLSRSLAIGLHYSLLSICILVRDGYRQNAQNAKEAHFRRDVAGPNITLRSYAGSKDLVR